MMEDGGLTGSAKGSGGAGGRGKYVLFAGDENVRYADITLDARNPNQPKRPIQIYGFEYGLANMAAFLSQAMVDGIYADACEEGNEQEWISPEGTPMKVWPQSNACGQYNASYQDLTCDADERFMECPVSTSMVIDSSKGSHTGLEGFVCGPRSKYVNNTAYPNDLKRDDVEG